MLPSVDGKEIGIGTGVKLRLHYRKGNPAQKLIWLLIALLFSFGTMTDLLGMPEAVRYSLDILWLLLLALLLRFAAEAAWQQLGWAVCWVISFFLLTAAVKLVRQGSWLTWLWGVRNNFRGYVLFFAGALFWTRDDREDFWRWIDRLFWLNTAVSAVQFALGYRQDFLGGLFGVYSGVNTYTNLFLSLVVSRSVVRFLAGEESFFCWASKCAAALTVAAMAELKFFFGEFLVILGLGVLLSERTPRKWVLVAGGGCIVLAGAALLSALFPGWGDWFSLENFWRVATDQRGYTASGDLNRLTAIPEIDRRFFPGFWEKVFGFGLGNCELSGFSFLTTDFARDYQYLHYHWMSAAFLYLETGWAGLVFFFGFFALLFCRAGKGKGDPLSQRITRILAVVCVMTGIYNASLRAEPGYLVYIAMSLAFVSGRESDEG